MLNPKPSILHPSFILSSKSATFTAYSFFLVCRFADNWQAIDRWLAGEWQVIDWWLIGNWHVIGRWLAGHLQLINGGLTGDLQVIASWMAGDLQVISRWLTGDWQVQMIGRGFNMLVDIKVFTLYPSYFYDFKEILHSENVINLCWQTYWLCRLLSFSFSPFYYRDTCTSHYPCMLICPITHVIPASWQIEQFIITLSHNLIIFRAFGAVQVLWIWSRGNYAVQVSCNRRGRGGGVWRGAQSAHVILELPLRNYRNKHLICIELSATFYLNHSAPC